MSSRRRTSNSSSLDSLALASPRVQIVQLRKAAAIREAKPERPSNVLLCSGKAGNYPAAGIILAIFSSFSFSIAIFLVKVVQSADPVLFVIYRGYFQLFLFTAVAIYNGHSLVTLLDRRSVFCLCLTGIFGSVQQVTSYYAIKYIPVADATAVLLSAPVFVSIFACVLLKEKCGLFQIVTVLLAMVGVFLVCRPSFIFGANEATAKIDTGNRIIGFGLIAFGCILMAAMYISLRKAAHVPFAITNAVLAVFSIVVGVCFSLVTGKGLGQPNCGWDSVFVVSSAVLGTTGMLMFVLATQIEHAGPVSVARTSEIVFAFVWQMSLLGDIPSWTSLLGATAVVSSVALIGFQKWAASKENRKTPFGTCPLMCHLCRDNENDRDEEAGEELRTI